MMNPVQVLSPNHLLPIELTERAESLAHELAGHAAVRPVVMGGIAMELATEWHHGTLPLHGDGAPIILLPRMSRWLVAKLGESDAIFVFPGRESAVRRARSLAAEHGVAFVAIGPSGGVTDRAPAAKTWEVADIAPLRLDDSAMPVPTSDAPSHEIRIEKQGRKYVVLLDDVVVATASNKQRALRAADVLRNDPDLVPAVKPAEPEAAKHPVAGHEAA